MEWQKSDLSGRPNPTGGRNPWESGNPTPFRAPRLGRHPDSPHFLPAGASGVLIRERLCQTPGARDQVEAIKAVSEHGPSTSGDGAETPSTLPQAIDNIARRYGLSEREHEVLELLVQGRSRAYIGERLSLASGTVGTYVSRIYEKVRVHSKQELLTIVYDEVATER